MKPDYANDSNLYDKKKSETDARARRGQSPTSKAVDVDRQLTATSSKRRRGPSGAQAESGQRPVHHVSWRRKQAFGRWEGPAPEARRKSQRDDLTLMTPTKGRRTDG